MLMGSGHAASVNTMTLFFVINLVIALGVLVLGGTHLARRWQHLTHTEEPRARTILVYGLGGLWIVDGILQVQPLMVTSFVPVLVAPVVQGQPWPISGIMHLGMHLWSLHPIMFDTLVVWLQIGIGVAILLGGARGGRRIGLTLSIVWGLMVWVFGEGLGQLFSRGSSLLGSPGSALIYALAAAGLLMPSSFWSPSILNRLWRAAQSVFWLLAAFLQAWPPNQWWSPSVLSRYFFRQATMPQPSWISGPIYAIARLAERFPRGLNGVIILLFLFTAVSWLVDRRFRVAWTLTLVTTFLLWWLGQDFGVFGGMGTDPNTAALILLGLFGFRFTTLFRRVSYPKKPETVA